MDSAFIIAVTEHNEGIRTAPLQSSGMHPNEVGFPVYVENDVNLLALNENMSGCLADSNHNITLMMDWGIGGAIVVDKQLVTGSSFVAGEFGQASILRSSGTSFTLQV